MKIYFAASIRGGRNDRDTYLTIITSLRSYGTVLTEHTGDTTLSELGETLSSSTIYKRDMAWLGDCDVVVAEVTQPSLGVGYEIAMAQEYGKQILCLYRPSHERRLSAMIEGNSKLAVREYADTEEASTIINHFMKTLPAAAT